MPAETYSHNSHRIDIFRANSAVFNHNEFGWAFHVYSEADNTHKFSVHIKSQMSEPEEVAIEAKNWGRHYVEEKIDKGSTESECFQWGHAKEDTMPIDCAGLPPQWYTGNR